MIIPSIFFIGIFQLIGYLIEGLDIMEVNAEKTIKQELVVMFFSFMGTISIVWIFCRYVDKIRFISIGFHSKGALKNILIGFTIGAVSILLGFILLLISKNIVLAEFTFNIDKILSVFAIFILVAVMEEVLCRGYILRNLMVSFNKYVALVISALIFALMHGANPNFNTIALINLFLAGILLGLPYMFYQSLWMPMATHLSWNFFQAILGFNVSGLRFMSFLRLKRIGSDLYTGGDFGFEGSLYSVIIQLLAIIGLFVYLNNKTRTK